MGSSDPDVAEPDGRRRRRLRAIFAADVANFGGLVSVDETNTLDSLWIIRRIALEELAEHGGWLFGLPGDGIFALFESAVDAVRCALSTQTRLAATPKLNAMRLRVGIHLGEVLFQDNLPFGEALVIASRLESLADPGGILISASVMEAVAPRISATFFERGVFNLKHSPRRVATFSVSLPASEGDLNESIGESEPLDHTVLSVLPPGTRGSPADVPVVPAPEIGSLPKATPLVIPNDPAPLKHLAHADADISGSTLGEACLADLVQALTPHLGPMAGVLVKRYLAKFTDPFELAEVLSEEIPAKAERLQFLSGAKQIIARHRH